MGQLHDRMAQDFVLRNLSSATFLQKRPAHLPAHPLDEKRVETLNEPENVAPPINPLMPCWRQKCLCGVLTRDLHVLFTKLLGDRVNTGASARCSRSVSPAPRTGLELFSALAGEST